MIAVPEETAAPGNLADQGEAGRRRTLGWLLPIAAAPVTFVLPSRGRHVSAAKVALFSLAVTVFFLFTGEYSFPGGAGQFTTFAEAIVQGAKLNPSIAQRDIGYPLLLLLGGWTVWRSFIGITLIQAAFAALMPLLVYWSIFRVSPAVGYYAGIASAISLAPILFMKWIHHDQAYIFLILLVVALLANFVQTRRLIFLYLFTLAAVAASFTRPAGNLLFPILLILAYLTARGRIVHYAACVAIVVATAVGYSWYRYQIFDTAHQPSPPSYTGEQVFYNMYINSGDFGIRLSPDVGPAMKHIDQALRQQLQPDLQQSAYIQAFLTQEPPLFATEAILPYTPDELIDRIYSAPNWEYYALLASAANDQLYVQASMEIARAHPQYVVQFVARNLSHMLFQPGFAHTRYTSVGSLQKAHLDFLPAGANFAGLAQYPLGVRGSAELRHDALTAAPIAVQSVFAGVNALWVKSFACFLHGTSVLMAVAWLGVLVRIATVAWPNTVVGRVLAAPEITATVACTIAASAFLLYNALVTAAFAEPDYRYFLFTELLRIVVAAYGVALVLESLMSIGSVSGELRLRRVRSSANTGLSRMSRIELSRCDFGRPVWLGTVVVVLTVAAFTSWGLALARDSRAVPTVAAVIESVPEHQMTVDFTTGMRLDGWSNVSLEQEQGERGVHLRLFWEAWTTPDFDYSAFLHLRGPGGFTIVGSDHGPGAEAGRLPHLWQRAQSIPDDWLIRVPPDAPAGAYQISVGVYDYRNLQPIPTTDGFASLTVGYVTL